MRKLAAVAFFVACTTLFAAADPAPPVRFPAAPKVDPPPPVPTPDGVPTRLDSGVLYVVDSDVDLMVKAYPVGRLKVTTVDGPLTIFGRFVDGKGANEVRKFAGKKVVIVEAEGTGEATLVLVPVGAKSASEWLERSIAANVAPLPPPDPPGPKPPDPKPPGPVASFRLIFVYESGNSLTAPERAILFGKVVEDWATANCTGGKAGWRRRDKDAPGEADPTMKAFWDAVKPNVTSGVPCVAIAVNERVVIEPLTGPDGKVRTPAEMVAILKTYRGQ